jgi:mono/diheme cytochrome c family protein
LNPRRRAALACLGLWAAAAGPARAGGVGAALFEGGPEASSVEARVGAGGGVPAPASRFACRACHGRDGQGGREGGSVAPSIDPDALAAPTGGRPLYDAVAFARALRDGADPGGRRLAPVMPRYRVSDEQAAELLSYLRAVAVRERAGVTGASVRFGVPATLAPDLVAAFRRAWLERGDPRVHGRRVTIESVGPAEIGGVAALLFAPRAPEGAGTGPWRHAAPGEALGPPVLFPVAPLQGGESPDLVRGLFASRADQAAALLRDAPGDAALAADDDGRAPLESAGAGTEERPVLPIDAMPGAEAASAVVVMAGPAGWQRLAASRRLRPGTTVYGCLDDAAGTIAELRRQGVRLVLADPRPGNGPRPLRPARERFASAAAAVLEAALVAAGRDLTRGGLLRALTGLAVEPPDWPALDFGRLPLTGSREVGLVRLAPLP